MPLVLITLIYESLINWPLTNHEKLISGMKRVWTDPLLVCKAPNVTHVWIRWHFLAMGKPWSCFLARSSPSWKIQLLTCYFCAKIFAMVSGWWLRLVSCWKKIMIILTPFYKWWCSLPSTRWEALAWRWVSVTVPQLLVARKAHFVGFD